MAAQPAHTQNIFDNKGNVANQVAHLEIHGNVTINSRSEDDLLSLLPWASQAAFNSYDNRHDALCLPDTRVGILSQIKRWADGYDERCIFWLNGMAGTGKSTIARTVAREYYDKEHLGASFFFSRGKGDISHAGKLFTTIAVQLAKKSPSLKSCICEAIKEHGDIASQGLHDQWVRLVLQPLSKMKATSDLSPLILVIDALDECESDSDTRVILQLLATAQKLGTVRLRIFLTSRPEIPIRHGFYQISETRHQEFVLHNISPSIVDHDIFVFLEHNLGIIRQEHALAADWPGQETIKRLVQNAAGLFIWAATTCRFITAGKRFAGRRLSLILQSDTSITAPEERLNEIYITILTNSIRDEYNDEEKEEVYKMLKAILGTIIILYSPFSAVSLASLLYIPKEDIDRTVDDLHSILAVPEDQCHPIRLHHPSFRDFLLDQQRCRDQHFLVNEKTAHKVLAQNCLKLMNTCLKRDICEMHAPGALTSEVDRSRVEERLRPEVQYACLYWVQHLQRSGAQLYDNDQAHTFLQKHFLHWLEALSLMQSMSRAVAMIRTLEKLLTANSKTAPDFFAIIQDANRFILYNKHVIERAPLQVYASALIFSPTKSIVRKTFRDEEPSWIKICPKVADDWSLCLQTLEGHTDWVYSVAFSHDGRRLASGSKDETVRIWDTETGALQQTIEGHTDRVHSVAFSHDGRRLASGSGDKTVRIWNTETGALQQTLKGHTRSVYSVAFSHDDRRLASGSGDKTVRIWDTEMGALQQTFEGHTGRVRSVAFSHDDRRLASASNDETVRIWDTETGALQQTFEGHTSWVRSAAFSHDDRRLASASNDETVRIWDTETGALQQTLKGHTDRVHSMAFSHDGRRLASGSHDETVRIWDTETGALQQTLEGHTDSVCSVAFSHDGRRLASSSRDETIRIWDTETSALQQTLEGHTDSVYSVAISHDDRRLASGSRDKTVRIWDTETGVLQQTLKGHTHWVCSVAFSHDDRRLAAGSRDLTVRIWDTETGALQQTLKGHTDSVWSVTFSHDDRRLASGSGDKTIRIWDTEMGALQQTLKGHTDRVRSVAFSHDDRRLASGSSDKTIRIWDIETGALQRTIKGHTEWVWSVTFSHDGRRLASGSGDKTARIWDTETGAQQQTLEVGTILTTLSFSPDGSVLNTEIGSFNIHKLKWSLCCLREGRSWIAYNDSNVLWLPQEYRSHSAIKGQTIMVFITGRVVMVNILL